MSAIGAVNQVSPSHICHPVNYFLSSLGVTAAIVFANLGAAYGTAKAGVGISGMGIMRGDLVMRSLIPVVMAGVLGIYGLITAVIINGKLDRPDTISPYTAYALLGAGLTVGLSSWAAGYAIGIVGDVGVRMNALASGKLFVGMILILIFAEVGGGREEPSGISLEEKVVEDTSVVEGEDFDTNGPEKWRRGRRKDRGGGRECLQALGLYGLIVGLVVASGASEKGSGLCQSYNV